MGLRQIYSVNKGDSDPKEALDTIMATRIYSVCDLHRTVRGKDQARGVEAICDLDALTPSNLDFFQIHSVAFLHQCNDIRHI